MGYDMAGAIIAFESGELKMEQVLELFQYLIDEGMVECLQGRYGRMAELLINEGVCHKRGEQSPSSISISDSPVMLWGRVKKVSDVHGG